MYVGLQRPYFQTHITRAQNKAQVSPYIIKQCGNNEPTQVSMSFLSRLYYTHTHKCNFSETFPADIESHMQ